MKMLILSMYINLSIILKIFKQIRLVFINLYFSSYQKQQAWYASITKNF